MCLISKKYATFVEITSTAKNVNIASLHFNLFFAIICSVK